MKKRLLTTLVVLTGLFLLSASIVWAQPAPVAKTGQTTSYRTGDDGDYEKGVASPNPRFMDNEDGTVIDNLTGLMWAKDTNLDVPDFQMSSWDYAIDYANNLSLGSNGCGASYTDWRLPNVRELQSLIDFSNSDPALPTSHPFTNVQLGFYWSSTTYNYPFMISARCVNMSNGNVDIKDKGDSHHILPVRGGN
jgi:hypothetical protein